MKRKGFGIAGMLVAILAAFCVMAGIARAQIAANVNAYVIDGTKAVYGIASPNQAMAATPTDVVVLVGSATKTVRVKKITVSGVATTAGSMDVSIVKRTTANTNGTYVLGSIGKHDSADATPTASPRQYTANGTLGTGAAIRNQTLNFGLAGAAGTVTFDFMRANDKPLILRGTSQSAAINMNGQAVPAGGKYSYDIEWEEY